MNNRIVARHQSGLWHNVDSPLFVKNTQRLRSGACTLVSRTECTDQGTNRTLRRDFQGEDWGYFHPRLMNRPIDCSLEWDKEYWVLQEKGLKQLTDFRVTTTGGVQLLPSTMPWVLLEYDTAVSRLLLLFSAAHNNLDNTLPRAAGWVDEGLTFMKWQQQQADRLARKYPKYRIIRLHQADVNKNFRQTKERMAVRNGMLKNTGLTWGWDDRHLSPDGQGTHGKQIIDYAFCNGVHSSKIMAGDKFSDHNPIETLIKVQGDS